MKQPSSHSQAGITLVEVLIAVLVLSIGLLGIAGLQTAALTANFTSYQYTQASLLAQGMVEKMRANRQGVLSGYYSMAASTSAPTPAPSTNCASTACSFQQQATYDMAMWYAQITGNLASGSDAVALTAQGSSSGAVPTLSNSAGSISCTNHTTNLALTNNMQCVVTVYWDPGRSATAGNFSCSPSDSTALRCFSVAFQPP